MEYKNGSKLFHRKTRKALCRRRVPVFIVEKSVKKMYNKSLLSDGCDIAIYGHCEMRARHENDHWHPRYGLI